MKTYTEKNTGYDGKDFLNINIQEYASGVWTPITNIKDEYKIEFDVEDENDDEESVWIYLSDVFKICVDPYNYEWSIGSERDEWLWEDFVNSIMKEQNHYLVCAYSCTWDGRTGYKIVDDIEDAFARSYDVNQYITGASKGGKTLRICESSHDVPMGHSVVIIGLTDNEYKKIENADWIGNFKSIMNFAERNSKSIIDF